MVASPALFVRDAVADERAGSVAIPVLLGGPKGRASAGIVTVNYATSNAGATAGVDYAAASGTLTFAPGETVKNVVVDITDDAAAEPAERFALTLSSPTGATISDGRGVVVIGASDATTVASPAISAPPDVVVSEGDGYVDLVVGLSRAWHEPGVGQLRHGHASASPGTVCNLDYVAASGTLTFAPGETTKVVRVDIDDCADPEGLESFTLELSDAGRARRSPGPAPGSTSSTTTRWSPRPALFVRDAVVDERAGSVTIPVLLGGPRARPRPAP